MKRNRWQRGLIITVLPFLLAVTGCETNENVRQNPAVSRTVLRIQPGAAVVSDVAGQNVVFTVTGGKPGYRWQIANTELGSVTGRGAQGVYSVSGGSGANFIIVTDAGGNSAGARIIQGDVAASSLAITPAITTLAADQPTATFTASGGEPPYRWWITNSRLGTLQTRGENAIYTRASAAGAHFIKVVDSLGHRAEAVIIQEWPALTISPATLTMAAGDDPHVFTADGGKPPYQWSLFDPALGTLSVSGQTAIYARNLNDGSQFIQVADDAGNRVEASVVQQP